MNPPGLLACPFKLHAADLQVIPGFTNGVGWLQRRNCTSTSVRTKPRFLPLFGKLSAFANYWKKKGPSKSKKFKNKSISS